MSEDPEPTEKKSASDDPTYVLMTVAGEQAKDADLSNYDRALHALNRRYWNGWQAQWISDDAKSELIKAGRATQSDLAPLTTAEIAEITRTLAVRCPKNHMSVPTNPVLLSETKFECAFVCDGFVFSGDIDFQNTTFSKTIVFRETTNLGRCTFRNATFKGPAYFDGATILRGAIFRQATFYDHAHFHESKLGRTTVFAHARFHRHAGFRNTTFAGDASFVDAIVAGNTRAC